MSPLNELLVNDFDIHQIWEQIQLQNAPFVEFLEAETAGLVKQGDLEGLEYEDETESKKERVEGDSEEEDGQMEGSESEMEEDADMTMLSDEEDFEDNPSAKQKLTGLPDDSDVERTIVDDEFFSLRQMEAFAEMAEDYDMRRAKEESGDEEDDDDDEELDDQFDLGEGFLEQDPDGLDADMDNANGTH